jgi:hypothetical protein
MPENESEPDSATEPDSPEFVGGPDRIHPTSLVNPRNSGDPAGLKQTYEAASQRRLNLNHKSLLANPQVKRWYDNVSRGSKLTADSYLRRLGWFCDQWSQTPIGLLSLDPSSIYDLLCDTVTLIEERREEASSYARDALKGPQSWLKFNNIGLGERTIRFSDPESTPTLENEQAPEPWELSVAFNYADNRIRAAMSLMSFLGCRPKVLGHFNGKDGLEIRDLPELVVDRAERRISFARIPTKVMVRKILSKTRHQYFGLLCGEGCRYLKEELERRLRLGHKLGPTSPIITNSYKDKEQHVVTKTVTEDIRAAFRKAGLPWRPYILRVYFDSRMMLAETKTPGFIRDYRTFLMGHKGDIEHVYTLNKKLPPSVEENIRESFSRATKYLETIANSTAAEDRGLEISKQYASGSAQSVVRIEEAIRMINEGKCRFVSNLPNGQVVVEPIMSQNV